MTESTRASGREEAYSEGRRAEDSAVFLVYFPSLNLTMVATLARNDEARASLLPTMHAPIVTFGDSSGYLAASSEMAIIAGVTYPGGKNGPGVYQSIINQQPPHERYFELFLGSGAVMRNKRPAPLSYGADLDVKPFKSYADSSTIPNLRLAEMDALEVLEQTTFYRSDLLYLDPPYLKETRRSQRNLYAHEMTREQHERLLGFLAQRPKRYIPAE